MKIYLQDKQGAWQIHQGTLAELSGELAARNIIIGERSIIGEWASIGKSAIIGEWAIIGKSAIIGKLASIGERAIIGEWAIIGKLASIGKSASIGESAIIGKLASIGESASIGKSAIIGKLASIGKSAIIGERAIIGESASIGKSAIIGERAIIGESASIEGKYGCVILSPLGSRQAPMTAYPHRDTIYIGTGCFLDSIEAFESAVRKTHAGTQHETEYLLALKYVREKFAKK